MGEPIVSLYVNCQKMRGTDINPEPRRWEETPADQRAGKAGTQTAGEDTRYWGTSESKGTREGHLAVVAEHSTEGSEARRTNREGGEPMPKGPTVGKAKSGTTFGWKET